MSVPACSCRSKERGFAPHARDCEIVVAVFGAPRRRSPVGAATVNRPPGALVVVDGNVCELDGLGRKARGSGRLGNRGVLTYSRGIGFRTRLEALVYDRLWAIEEARPDGGGILRQPRFDLWRAWRLGMGKPLTFTPDFQVLRAALGPAGLLVTAMEIHEAKGPRALESRDYVARLAAFRAGSPWLPVTVWRRDKAAGPSALVREDLPPLGGGFNFPVGIAERTP